MVTIDTLRKMHNSADIMYYAPQSPNSQYWDVFDVPEELKAEWIAFVEAKNRYNKILKKYEFSIDR